MGRANVTIGSMLLAASAMLGGQAVAADMPVKAAPYVAPASGPGTAVWLGGAFKDRAWVGFVGAVAAVNGNLDTDGFLVRGQYLYVNWDFDSTLSSTGTASGTLNRGDIQLGYQIVRNGMVAAGFIGVDYQDYNYSPSITRDARLKDQPGAIFTGRWASAGATTTPFSVEGNYSTANNAYWVRGRVGYDFGWVAVGPEVGVLGNRVFDEARYGGYMSFTVNPSFIVELNGGYADRLRGDNVFGGGSGGYGGVTLVFLR
ncbi:MAG: cellulose biosynthesis protein BcsS [Xanthobacteraceae bacterium]|nr:cellulose biosynthesis protein BcsS [Xanthobacteraceae bacterium]